ncbi:MAG: RNA polymerase factor sigma-54 [Bacteroidales bacterium]|nr:RNA polymerase factor sigma-54 [Bacteroidales bacterium]
MLKQTLQQKLQQKLSPQQIQLMKLLQIPVMSLEQRIKEEIEENPVLEDAADIGTTDEDEPINEDLNKDSGGEGFDETDDGEDNGPADDYNADNDFSFEEYMRDDEDDIPAYKLYANNKSKDDEKKEMPMPYRKSFFSYLHDQLYMLNLTDDEFIAAENIIGNLNEAGYLNRELISISDDLIIMENIEMSADEIEKVLKEVQTLDPAGIGARDLQECLLLQLRRMPQSEDVDNAIMILEKCMEEFTKKHYPKIITKLRISEDQLKRADAIILKLNPKPGGSVSETEKDVSYVFPDFIITLVEGEPVLTLASTNSPDLRIKKSYVGLLQVYNNSAEESKKEAATYIKQKIDSANNFIDLIQQRQKTLFNTMSAIMERQHDFFTTGDETKLKPMVLKDIADKIDMNISTVSRVVNSKYVRTPYGTFLLKYFFSESMENNLGEEVSTREIKAILMQAVDNEDRTNPLTDDELMSFLKDKGYPIARRTVAKYRQQLNIPVARLRKQIK